MKFQEKEKVSETEERNQGWYEQEYALERERKQIRSYYPKNAARIQALVEDACDRMDYEGSFLYDEYPDKQTVERACRRIWEEQEENKEVHIMEKEMIQTLFCHEMYLRRCRRERLKRI